MVAHVHHVWKVMDSNLSQEISKPDCFPSRQILRWYLKNGHDCSKTLHAYHPAPKDWRGPTTIYSKNM